MEPDKQFLFSPEGVRAAACSGEPRKINNESSPPPPPKKKAPSYWFYLCNYFLVRLVRPMKSLAPLRVVAACRVVAIWLAQTSTRRKSLLSRLFRPWWGKKKSKWLQRRSVTGLELRWCRMTNDTQVAPIIWISASTAVIVQITERKTQSFQGSGWLWNALGN